jgi:hypothetical protein
VLLANLDIGLWFSGLWDDLLSDGVPEDTSSEVQSEILVEVLVTMVRTNRGTLHDTSGSDATNDLADDPYIRASISMIQALRLASKNRYAEAADLAVGCIESALDATSIDDDYVLYWPFAVEYALAAGQIEQAQGLLTPVADAPPGLVTPLVHAQLLRLRAMTSLAAGHTDQVDGDLTRAVEELRAFGAPFYLARTLLTLAELRQHTDVPVTPLLQEARTIFELLSATPWVEAVDKLTASVAV